MRLTLTAILSATLAIAGCLGEDPFDTAPRQVDPGVVGVSLEAADPMATPPAATDAPATETSPQPKPPEKVVRKKAKVGVGKKGDYGPGLVTTPVSVYFRAREKIIFTIKIPHAMNLYKATNGKAPQSHGEFMETIIKPNQIELPQLPEGERYVYLPEKEALFVEQPRQ